MSQVFCLGLRGVLVCFAAILQDPTDSLPFSVWSISGFRYSGIDGD